MAVKDNKSDYDLIREIEANSGQRWADECLAALARLEAEHTAVVERARRLENALRAIKSRADHVLVMKGLSGNSNWQEVSRAARLALGAVA